MLKDITGVDPEKKFRWTMRKPLNFFLTKASWLAISELERMWGHSGIPEFEVLPLFEAHAFRYERPLYFGELKDIRACLMGLIVLA